MRELNKWQRNQAIQRRIVLHNWPHIKPQSSTVWGKLTEAKTIVLTPKNTSQQHHKPATVYHKKQNFFKITFCFEFQHLPRNNGRHLPNNSPPREKKKKKKKSNNREIPPPAPSPKANGTTEEPDWKEKQGREIGGGVTGQRGEKRGGGGSGDGQRADAKTTGVGKLQSRARTEKLS